MGLAVGIDLGTTNSVIAWIDQYQQPVIIPNAEGNSTTPSVVCFKDGDAIVGEVAKEYQAAGEPLIAAYFKRQMGNDFYSIDDGDREWGAQELSSLVIGKLKEDAERELGQEITDAVITVPAYFKNAQRERTIEAGRLAGLNVLATINEPTAAALAYGMNGTKGKRCILVYDLGGGTFDVTLLTIDEGEITIITSDGDSELGGKDWDDILLDHCVVSFEELTGVDPTEDLESVADLLVKAEDVKKRLSKSMKSKMSLFHDGRREVLELGRAVFEELSQDLLGRTMAITEQVLESHGMTPSDVDDVLLVGGSTRMPMVGEALEKLFGKVPVRTVNPDEAVAQGAAILAAQKTKQSLPAPTASSPGMGLTMTRVKDVTNHTLGVIALNADGTEYVNSRILSKDTPIPCEDSQSFKLSTRPGGDNYWEIYMTQGESGDPAHVDYLGIWRVYGVPHNPDGTTVVATYAYNENGTVDVAGSVADTGQALSVEINPLPDDIPLRFTQPPVEPQAESLTVYLCFDMSGSMGGSPIQDAKAAAHGFIDQLGDSASIGIIAFSDRSEVVTMATDSVREAHDAVDRLEEGQTGYCNAGHPFGDILRVCSAEQGRRVAVVLADGLWESPPVSIKAAKQCHDMGIDVIAIGFGTADADFMKQIASTDEAGLMTTQGGLGSTFNSIARELASAAGGLSSQPFAGSGLYRK